VDLDPNPIPGHEDDNPDDPAITRPGVQHGIRHNLASQQDRVICCRISVKDTADELPCPRHLVTLSREVAHHRTRRHRCWGHDAALPVPMHARHGT
jgi:hypothetical protein